MSVNAQADALKVAVDSWAVNCRRDSKRLSSGKLDLGSIVILRIEARSQNDLPASRRSAPATLTSFSITVKEDGSI
jgi:hypothetical protein